jgi:uncharacterized lipoprotein
MADFAALLRIRALSKSVILIAAVGLASACSTLHEADLGANRGYNELGGPAYKPSLSSPKGKTSADSKPLAKAPNRKAQYSPMVERTATGVRVVQDFTTQARSKSAKTNAAQARATRAQQNNKISKSYNNDNLLNR